jgi:hypothetical protein
MSQPRRAFALALSLALVPAAAAADVTPPTTDGAMSAWFQELWRGLPTMENGCSAGEKGVDWFDYGFPGGGMRTFYCYLRSKATLAGLEKAAPVPMFASGPHKPGKLDFASQKSFGHYNPDFVRWLGRAAVPRAGDSFRAATLPLYEAKVRPLARIYYVTYVKMHSNGGRWMEQEKRALGREMARPHESPHQIGAGFYEKYALFMNPAYFAHQRDEGYLMDHGFDGGWDCNLVKTAVGFWLRRSLDGTDELFFGDLKQLLAAYDADFLANPAPPKPSR